MPHPFTSDGEIAAIGRAVLDRTLPKRDWTHAAHFAAALFLLEGRSVAEVSRAMPGIIRAYNEATGVANTDQGGYHETITLASIRAAGGFSGQGVPLFEACNALLASPLGRPDWLLAYWSRPVLFSVEARRAWREPDLRPMPF